MGDSAALAAVLPDAAADAVAGAFAAAAINARSVLFAPLAAAGARIAGFGPDGLHAHATARHQTVASGSLATVNALLALGARRDVRDRVHEAKAISRAAHLGAAELDWAAH
ncbi:MAG: hypothetical protein AAF281_16870, partial [Pseudomonadota bacterium]